MWLADMVNRVLPGAGRENVPIARLRCNRKPFAELQGFSGRPISAFPPCLFYQLYHSGNVEAARRRYFEWIRYWLLDKEAWKIPKCYGGWQTGSLMKAILELHREQGFELQEFAFARRVLVLEAIWRRVDSYIALFESIKQLGYIPDEYGTEILCCSETGRLYIRDGHHRAAAMSVLGRQKVRAKVVDWRCLKLAARASRLKSIIRSFSKKAAMQ